MRSLLTGALVFLLAGPASGGEIRHYGEKIVLGEDGRAVVEVRVSGASGGPEDTVALPFAPPVWPDSIGCSAPLSAVVPCTSHGRLQALLVLGEGVGVEDTLLCRYYFHAYPPASAQAGEFGNRVIAYRAVHTLPDSLSGAEVTVVLPPGFVTNRVLSSTPAAKANSSALPYALGLEDGRHAVTLRAAPVLQGDAVALSFEVRRPGSPVVLIVVLAVVGCAYLAGFRDLVFPSKAKDGGHGAAL